MIYKLTKMESRLRYVFAQKLRMSKRDAPKRISYARSMSKALRFAYVDKPNPQKSLRNMTSQGKEMNPRLDLTVNRNTLHQKKSKERSSSK